MSTLPYKFPFLENEVDMIAFNRKMKAKYHSEFEMCTIDVGLSLNPLLINEDAITSTDHRIIDLKFLDGLRSPHKEAFLPSKLYIRDNMRKIFGLYVNDTFPPNKRRTVLVGSPGVGKSILFFLAAIYRVHKQSDDQKWATIYFRRTKTEDISAFIMVPQTEENGNILVHVMFTRTLQSKRVASLNGLSIFFEDELNIQRDQYYAFVNGPRHDKEKDTLNGFYDFFCTSGGHPPFKCEQYETCRLWILNGWSEQESIEGLSAVFGNRDTNEEPTQKAELIQKAKEAYWLWGGIIRNQVKAFNDDIEEGKKMLKDVILGVSKVDILYVTKSTNEELIPNGLRTMFRRDNNSPYDDLMIALQIVDSQYILEILTDEELNMDHILTSYKEAKLLNENAIQGYYFKFIIHKYFVGNKCEGISVCWAKGSSIIDDVQMFSKEANMCWIPGIKNKQVIDSAVVIKKVLHAFQMTVSTEQIIFDKMLFQTTMLDPIETLLGVRKVVIYLVTPNDINQNMNQYQGVGPDNNIVSSGSSCNDSKKQKLPAGIEYELVQINMQNVNKICRSIQQEIVEKITKD